jgi:hypothetical protein
VPAPIITKAKATAPTKHDTVVKSDDEADAEAAEAAAEANIIIKTDTIPAQNPVDDEITSSEEATLMAGAEEYNRMEMEMEMEKQATILAYLSTPLGNQANNSTINSMTPPLAPPFKTAAKAQAKAAAQEAAANALQSQAKIAIPQDSIQAKAATADAKAAKPNANEIMAKAHEQKVKLIRTKV